MLKSLAIASALLCLFSINAEARQRHRRAKNPEIYSQKYSQKPHSLGFCTPTGDIMRPCAYQPDFLAGVKSIRVRMHRERHSANLRAHQPRQMASEGQIVAHPSECPWRAFCGCGAAVRVFGHSVRELWLAANWFRFPRAAPAAGMVAVRRHHVFVLEHQLSGNIWMAWDANSGRHLTQVHPRSITGFAIVDPHGLTS